MSTSTNGLTDQDALVFGRRLDAFAAGLTPGERTLLTAILHDAEAAQHDDVDHRTPGEIAIAIHRMYRTPPISLNPQPIPPHADRFRAASHDLEDPIYSSIVSKE